MSTDYIYIYIYACSQYKVPIIIKNEIKEFKNEFLVDLNKKYEKQRFINKNLRPSEDLTLCSKRINYPQ